MVHGFKFFLILLPTFIFSSKISLGIDTFLEKENIKKYKNKRIGVVTNVTAISGKGILTIDRLLKQKQLKIKKIFAPEHGFFGANRAQSLVSHDLYKNSVPIISLHGKIRRPTKQLLKDLDVLIFDIQDIGVRSYTYITTLFYCMEEAAKHNIEVCVLDRPNPMGGINFDGPMIDYKFRSFIGYINVPYCHGMTVCELALLFNKEYNIKCKLSNFLMKGWNRKDIFTETGLLWVPTSPNIPEPDTPFYYATTGCLGELSVTSIGIGTTSPFKVVGATWIDAEKLSNILNKQNLPGVTFTPFYFTPIYGNSSKKLCKGIKIHITDHTTYKPCMTGNMILGMLKSLYPKIVKQKISTTRKGGTANFHKSQGSDKYLSILENESFPAYKLIQESEKGHKLFLQKKKQYTLYQ